MQNEKKLIKALDASDLNQINAAIQILKEKLNPYLNDLDEKEKKRMAKAKDKSVAFIQKTYEYAIQNEFMIPAQIDPNETKVELDTTEVIRQLINPLAKLVEGMEDTNFVLYSELYTNALAMYNTTKLAAKRNIPGAKLIYDDLKVRFKGNGQRKSSADKNKSA